MNYEVIMKQVIDHSGKIDYKNLIIILEDAWILSYEKLCKHKTQILQFNDNEFTYLFDFVSSDPENKYADDRVVVVYGYSKSPINARDRSRMRGFLGGGIRSKDGNKYDKGHFLAHTAGGGLDVNLFPQNVELNRGWSPAGKIYRKMERYVAEHSNTFVFSRPIYKDETWLPSKLEYGISLPNGKLWVEIFNNVPNGLTTG